MTNFNYYKVSNTKKLRYLINVKKNTPFIVFLIGFMSNLDGKKPENFFNFAKKNKLVFLLLNTLDMENHLENLSMAISQNGVAR